MTDKTIHEISNETYAYQKSEEKVPDLTATGRNSVAKMSSSAGTLFLTKQVSGTPVESKK